MCYGQTGTGKTTLAEALLREHAYVVALDTKANPPLAWVGYQTFTDFSEIRDLDRSSKLPSRIIFEPAVHDIRAMQAHHERDRETSSVAEFFRWVYARGSTTLYVDEVFDVVAGPFWMPEGYDQCLTRGRSRFITVLSSTQTPMSIPSKIMSQAEHSYVFFLKMPGERKKVEQMTGVPEDTILELPKTYFIYSEQGRKTWRLMHLNLGR